MAEEYKTPLTFNSKSKNLPSLEYPEIISKTMKKPNGNNNLVIKTTQKDLMIFKETPSKDLKKVNPYITRVNNYHK